MWKFITRRWRMRVAELEKQLAENQRQFRELQQRERIARAHRDNAETRKAWLNADWHALRPDPEREAILKAFREHDRNHPLVAAMRMILESTYEEAVGLTMAPEMSDKPGQLAHAAGGAYWLALLNERMRDAIIEAQRNPRISSAEQ